MSVLKIYKIHILQDEKTTKSIHVFGGLGVTNLEDYLKKDPTGFTPEEQKEIQEKNIPLFFSPYQLHPDDTIGTVKMKIIEENSYDFSLEEMYLFCKKEETFNVCVSLPNPHSKWKIRTDPKKTSHLSLKYTI